MTTRRSFIKSGAIAAFGVSVCGIPSFVLKAAAAAKSNPLYKKNKVLICIFQRGAMDGLMAVTPFTDMYLKAARPSLFMSSAKASSNGMLLDLDGRFGLHPAMSAFEPLFRNKQLSIVHGIGSPNNTRSHFDAQDYMESGTPFNKGTDSGWLNRASAMLGQPASPFRSVSLTASMPRSFYGLNPAIALTNLQDFSIRSNKNVAGGNLAAKSFEDLYDETTNSLLQETGKETFDAVAMLSKLDLKNYTPANGAEYPKTTLGNAMKQIAQLIKADVGLEIGFTESTGWDTHYNQGTEKGNFARSAADLSNSITAFWKDIGADLQDDVTVMTMTEFGRTVKQNGTNGTDHGRGSCNFIIGNNLDGGKVFGEVKPLAIENLEDGRDLPVTTDYRTVFSEVANKHLKLKNSASLFPGWDAPYLHVLKG